MTSIRRNIFIVLILSIQVLGSKKNILKCLLLNIVLETGRVPSVENIFRNKRCHKLDSILYDVVHKSRLAPTYCFAMTLEVYLLRIFYRLYWTLEKIIFRQKQKKKEFWRNIKKLLLPIRNKRLSFQQFFCSFEVYQKSKFTSPISYYRA